MNTDTGQLMPIEDVRKLPTKEQSKYAQVTRDLTKIEELEMQIKLYSPCGCGSGKKFKFCCKTNPQPTDNALTPKE